jgi:hypothetical protein
MSQIVVIFAVSFRYEKVDERERERCEDVWGRERGSVYSKRLAKKSKNSVMPWSRWILKQEKRRDGSGNEICNTERNSSTLISRTLQKKRKKKRLKRGREM